MPYGTPTTDPYSHAYRGYARHEATGVWVTFESLPGTSPGPEPESETDEAFQAMFDLISQASGWTIQSAGKWSTVGQSISETP